MGGVLIDSVVDAQGVDSRVGGVLADSVVDSLIDEYHLVMMHEVGGCGTFS